ncbi:MAG: NAD(P)-binding protein, partial [Nitrospira sp.]|nr:NAD(P)-binding protein [Nitrospira sp.]
RGQQPMNHKPFAITLDPNSSLANHTGNWRTMKPVYVDRLPPCNHACPAGENIQAWLYLAEEKDYEAAWRRLMEDNPMPAIHGRVCYHPCETACNRGQLDEAVSIRAVERFLGDLAIKEGWRVPCAPSTGKKVLIVGAGPSGLSAAYHLTRMGYAVTIYEAAEKVGGMMRYGIPAYRLPRDVVDAEAARLETMGVTIRVNARVEDLDAAIQEGGFHATFLAVGAHLARRIDIPGFDAKRLLDAATFLRSMASASAIKLGRRVAVYGGGNTAIDVARTAERLGAEPVIIYRRDEAHAPSFKEEIAEAREEGVQFQWLRRIAKADEAELTVEVMELDEHGTPRPTSRFETIEADTVVLALGQKADTGFLRNMTGACLRDDGTVEVDEQMMTGHPGLFAGGDMVPGEQSVSMATGHGKLAARHIDAYLRGIRYVKSPSHPLATFDRLNPWYYTDAEQSKQPVLALARRRASFEEMIGGLDPDTALLEARRCLSCGNCFECDNCYAVCPDNAVIKLGTGNRFEINYDYCKGCGLCAEECPCGAIDMVKEVK